jgi:hypothetical protein
MPGFGGGGRSVRARLRLMAEDVSVRFQTDPRGGWIGTIAAIFAAVVAIIQVSAPE